MNTGPNYENFKSPHVCGVFLFPPESPPGDVSKKNPVLRDEYRAQLWKLQITPCLWRVSIPAGKLFILFWKATCKLTSHTYNIANI